MNLFLSVTNKKSVWPFILTITIFLFFPYVILTNTYIWGTVLLAFITLMLLLNMQGVSIVIFAYGCILPYGELGIGTGVARYFLFLYILVYFFFVMLNKKNKLKYPNKLIILSLIIVFILEVTYYLNNGNNSELLTYIFYLLSTYIFFYLCLNDSLELKNVFLILDIIFLFTFMYVLEEFIYKNSPYQIYYNNLSLDFQLRAKGLMGHPLLLSSFISFYNISIIIRKELWGRYNVLGILLIIPLVILSASKTLLLLFVFAWIVYFVLNQSYKNISFYVFGILVVYFGLELFPVLSFIFDASIQRILDSSANHRIGAYSVAFEIFKNNLLGIGTSLEVLSNEVNRAVYNFDSNYDKFFLIFDNAFLTAIVSFGFFSIFFFIVFIHPVWLILSSERLPFLYKKIVILLSINWFLQNFSFDSCYYFTVNAFYFILMGLIVKETYKKIKIQK